MNNTTKILILIFFIAGFLYSQTFQLGFRTGLTFYSTTQQESRPTPYFHFLLSAGLNEKKVPILSDLTEEIRFGRAITPDYWVGNDLEFVLKSHVIKNNFYLTAGLNMHSNIGSNGTMWAVYVKRIYMLLFGIGVSPPNSHAFIEVSTYIPISNPVVGESDLYNFLPPDYNNYNFLRKQWKLNYIIAINLGLTLDIFHFK